LEADVANELTGKVAIVTGAAKGIGLGCARVLGRAGALIGMVDIDAPALNTAVGALGAEGITAMAFAADVSLSDDVHRMVAAVLSRYGRVDIVLNNAGTHDGKSIEQASEADWDRVIATNLKSVFLVNKAALPHLKQTRGAIINMSSMVRLVGQSNAGAYAASKGGIIALTKNMALDFAPYGIRVNCICPGWVETPLVQTWFRLQPDEHAARNYIDSIHPLGRIATPEDVGRAALFLCSEMGAFVTGVALPVDGGVALGY
jgi:NAD(P)-dependent dehydrogenase (short-subunit alcohol dehydrogenase family)